LTSNDNTTAILTQSYLNLPTGHTDLNHNPSPNPNPSTRPISIITLVLTLTH